MGVNDYGTGTNNLNAPSLAAWAASVAAALDGSDTSVDDRIAAAVTVSHEDGLTGPGVDPTNYGAVADGTTDDTTALQAALDAADAAGTYVQLADAAYKITGAGLQAKGAGLVGVASRSTSNTASTRGSRLVGVGNTGPILTIGSTSNVSGFMGIRHFRDFGIIGDGTSAGGGLYMTGAHDVTLDRVYVKNTVGIPWLAEACYFVQVRDCAVQEPVSCVANNTPYIKLRHCNSWTTDAWLLRGYSPGGVATVADVGAVIVEDNGTFESVQNAFRWVIEYLRPREGGVGIVDHRGNGNHLELSHFDSTNAGDVTTPWAGITLNPGRIQNYGGNLVTGLLLAHYSDPTTLTAYGVKVVQSNNAVFGVAGYQTKSVYLASGVNNCSVELVGSFSSPSGLQVDDASGTTTNRIASHGVLRTSSTQSLGFFGATPVTRPAVTGSRGGNAALASLLTQLASLGLITDSTSA